MTLNVDMKAFRASLQKVRDATKKEEAVIVNGALKDIAFRAASFTPKSSASKISSIPKKVLARIAVAHLTKTRSGFTRSDIKETMKKILKARKSHVGALRAGWIPAIQAFGGTYRGAKLSPASTAARGGAKKATIANLSGAIINTIVTRSHNGKHSAEHIAVAVAGLERAVAFVTKDKNDYAQRKIDALLTKLSD